MRLEFDGTIEEFREVLKSLSGLPSFPLVSATEAKAPTVELPPAPQSTIVSPPSTEDGIYGKAPRGEPHAELTMRISDEKRQAAWQAFCDFVKLWLENFGEADSSQPDRVQAMKDLGGSPHSVSVLVMAYELRSLQKLVFLALKALGDNRATASFADTVSAHMLQLSHVGFPDITGTYDYGVGWRKTISEETQ